MSPERNKENQLQQHLSKPVDNDVGGSYFFCNFNFLPKAKEVYERNCQSVS